MNYLKFPLNHQAAGAAVEVTLQGVESDVFLVDSINFSRFQRGQQFSYHGGHSRSSLVHLTIPSSGTWTVVVIPGGVGQRVSASVRTFAAA